MILKVKNLSNIGGVVKAPPSKSYTHRAIIIASLADGNSILHDPLISEDTISSIDACRLFGAEIDLSSDNSYLKIKGIEKIENHSKGPIDLKNSGTTLRIMTSVAGLAQNETIFTGDDSLKSRPMQMLLDGIKPLGGNTISILKNGKPPIAIKPGFVGGKSFINGNVSSQFISSILIAGAISEKGIELEVKGDFISKSYVAMTLDVMEKFGIKLETDLFTKHPDCDLVEKKCSSTSFFIKPQKYIATDYVIEGDYSSASYLLGAIAILGGEIKVKNLFKDSKQGDKLILAILEDMGAEITVTDDSVTLKSEGNLKGVNIDLHNAPDLLPTVSVLGAMAKGKTTITGVHHARFKETDRIDKCAEELTKLKCEVEEKEDGLIIQGGVSSGTVNSHDDHRIAMAFSLIGLKHEIAIENGNVFSVSFPNFIESMAEIGVELDLFN
ncbi:3-phosphoshikimate 1-carboxyvinyltransferase [Methanobrevibacter cuticularis]|uniref:3-phosphoshikimate 1-carboxyvinyltransferase n=1 Tax=Methanobrevibacter cuticularis TaxID=47311 RepID=A0A166EDI4_9EURY|nr:3-phosphoshikimate 1-carboxyvinyltransferase [Methanobrevibacter cuticularis]KZX16536.1 3-phosphoshikimate 1-carboxyvinyltransferase [Methanobrevibacter cuticularis]